MADDKRQEAKNRGEGDGEWRPSKLSFSMASTYQQCPRRWKYEYILGERVGTSLPALIGSFVHEILEHLYKEKPTARTIDTARDISTYLWPTLQENDHFVQHELTKEEAVAFKQSVWTNVHGLFQMEDPTKVDVIATEQKLMVEIDGVPFGGYVDRLDDDGNGGVIVRDYKGFPLDTKIPTPTGWTTMGVIGLGDTVYDMDGTPCLVTGKSQIHNNPCYELVFDDGSTIVADHEHRWVVDTDAGRKTLTTEDIAENIVNPATGQKHMRIPMNKPISSYEADLPIHPWVLGAWLGDGKHTSGELTWADAETPDLLESFGYKLGTQRLDRRTASTKTGTILGIRGHLVDLGVFGNKHIPQQYLRAQESDRILLLMGLMDSDGSWNVGRRQGIFVNTNKNLVDGFCELLASLGIRYSLWSGLAHGYGVTTTQHKIAFNPSPLVPFLGTKRKNVTSFGGASVSARRLVVEVRHVDSVPTQCITVDSPTETYLVGERMIVTHNTGKPGAKAYHPKKLKQVQLYAAMVKEELQMLPTRVSLVFPSHGETVEAPVTTASMKKVTKELGGVWEDIHKSIDTDVFPPSVGPLCAWCDFVAECPEGAEEAISRWKEGRVREDAPAIKLLGLSE